MGKKGWKKIHQAFGTGWKEKRLEQIGKIGEQLANEYCLQAAVITGIPRECGVLQEQKVALLYIRSAADGKSGGGKWSFFLVFCPKIGGSYSGTGDLFASVLSAGLVKEMSMMTCVELAVNFPFQGNCPDGTGRNRPE